MKQVPNSINEPQGTGKDCDVIAPMQSHRGMKGCLRDGWRIFALQARKLSCRSTPCRKGRKMPICLRMPSVYPQA